MGHTELDSRALRRAANRAASGYDRQALLQHEVCDRALERLDYIRCEPALVLDIGTGTGRAARALAKRYRRARVVGLDVAEGMLRGAAAARRWRRPALVQADAASLPLREASADLVFSASTLHACSDPRAFFAEVRRVLRPGGCLLFATFGPDTLKELREAWAAVDDAVHVHDFPDMHLLGDAMLAAGLSDPVVDAEWLRVDYAGLRELMRELKGSGESNASPGRSRGLRGRRTLARLDAAYAGEAGGRRVATYEVVYGHAWAPPQQSGQVRVRLEPGLR